MILLLSQYLELHSTIDFCERFLEIEYGFWTVLNTSLPGIQQLYEVTLFNHAIPSILILLTSLEVDRKGDENLVEELDASMCNPVEFL